MAKLDSKSTASHTGEAMIAPRTIVYGSALLATAISIACCGVSQAAGTPSCKDALKDFLQALQEGNEESLQASMHPQGDTEVEICRAYIPLLLAERKLSQEITVRFNANQAELCDELAVVSDAGIKDMLAAISTCEERSNGDRDSLLLTVGHQNATVAFLLINGVWRIDLPEYFHWNGRPTLGEGRLIAEQWRREMALVNQLSSDVLAGKAGSTKAVMGRLMEGLASIEQPVVATTQNARSHEMRVRVPATEPTPRTKSLVAAPNEALRFAVAGHFIAAEWGDYKVSLLDFESARRLPVTDLGAKFGLQDLILSDSVPPRISISGFPAGNPRRDQVFTVADTGLIPWRVAPESDAGRCVGFCGDRAIWFSRLSGIRTTDIGANTSTWAITRADVLSNRGLKISSDGLRLAVCSSAGLQCSNQKGELIWNFPVSDRRRAVNGDNCRFAPQPFVGEGVGIFDDSAKELVSIDMSSGRVNWRFSVDSLRDVAAVSADGSMAVVGGRSGPQLVKPKNHSILPLRLNSESEFFFGESDRCVVVLPAISKLREAGNERLNVERNSNQCIIIDSSTGNAKSQFAIN